MKEEKFDASTLISALVIAAVVLNHLTRMES
jgi:hypothetical protein